MPDYVYELAKNIIQFENLKDQPLSEDVVRKLVEAGQSASTSSYLQTYSIIGVEDPEIKSRTQRSIRTTLCGRCMAIYSYLF